MTILAINDANRPFVTAFFEQPFGQPAVMSAREKYRNLELEGFLAIESDQVVGVLTYTIWAHELRIVTLDTLLDGEGVASSLLKQVEMVATRQQLRVTRIPQDRK